MSLKIGISGKRCILEKDRNSLPGEIESSIRKILSKHKTSEFIGYSALAIGADTFFAEVVTKVFKMPLQIVLPFPIEEYQKDFNESEAIVLNEYCNTHSPFHILSNQIPVNDNARNDAYLNGGIYLADNCDEMIFVWDEVKPGGKGGTAEIMGYFSEKNKKVPVDYIPVSPLREDNINDAINKAYNTADKNALINRDKYKASWQKAIKLGWLSVFIFALNTTILSQVSKMVSLVAVLIECLLVFLVFFIIWSAKRNNYHGKYLKERLDAETLRLLKYFYHTNVEIRIPGNKQDTNLELLHIADRINKKIKSETYTSKWYVSYTIKSLIHEQISYHSGKVKSIGDKYHFFERVKSLIAVVFAINLVLHLGTTIVDSFFNDFHIPHSFHESIIFFNIILPASYAAVEGWLFFQELKKVKKNSEFTEKRLRYLLSKMCDNLNNIDESVCTEKHSTTLNKVANLMLSDNTNWNLIFEDKDNYQWVV